MTKIKRAIAMTIIMLKAADRESKKQFNKVKAGKYKKLYNLVKKIPKVGLLNANHLLGLMALSGVIPLILFEDKFGGAIVGYKRLDEKHLLQEKILQ